MIDLYLGQVLVFIFKRQEKMDYFISAKGTQQFSL